jgi:hypothetical protein
VLGPLSVGPTGAAEPLGVKADEVQADVETVLGLAGAVVAAGGLYVTHRERPGGQMPGRAERTRSASVDRERLRTTTASSAES